MEAWSYRCRGKLRVIPLLRAGKSTSGHSTAYGRTNQTLDYETSAKKLLFFIQVTYTLSEGNVEIVRVFK